MPPCPDWKVLFFRLLHGAHDQRFNSACIHTRSIRSCRGRSVSEPEGNERISCPLKESNRPARDARLTSADCRSEDGTSPYQTVKHHPGEERRVHSLEVAKVSGPRSFFVAPVQNVVFCMLGSFWTSRGQRSGTGA